MSVSNMAFVLPFFLACNSAGSGSDRDASSGPDRGPADARITAVVPVACDSVFEGPVLENGTEAEPGYFAAFSQLNLSRVADPYDYSQESWLKQGVINYMLGRSGTTLSHAEAQAVGNLGLAILAAVAVDDAVELDFGFLRQGLFYFYVCSRPIPTSLEQLKIHYGDYQTWPTETIACSKPKNGPRRIRTSHEAGVYIAETLLPDETVRETEVIFTNLRTDHQLDFAVYTPTGVLTNRSSFATGGGGTITSAVPYACMTCHLDGDTHQFSVLAPTGKGAGCQNQ